MEKDCRMNVYSAGNAHTYKEGGRASGERMAINGLCMDKNGGMRYNK